MDFYQNEYAYDPLLRKVNKEAEFVYGDIFGRHTRHGW